MQTQTLKGTKVSFELDDEHTTARVKISRNGTVETFRVSDEAITSIFSGNYCSGYLPCSQDGVVFLEERDGKKMVVIQRGGRKQQKIVWDRHDGSDKELIVDTPFTFFFFILNGADGGGWQILKERIYVSSGPCRGPGTPIYDAHWVGNVYRSSGGYVPNGHTKSNICWGGTRVAPNNVVTVPSLMNIAGDFYTQDFTQHLGGNKDTWAKYTNSGKFPQTNQVTLAERIRQVWSGTAN